MRFRIADPEYYELPDDRNQTSVKYIDSSTKYLGWDTSGNDILNRNQGKMIPGDITDLIPDLELPLHFGDFYSSINWYMKIKGY